MNDALTLNLEWARMAAEVVTLVLVLVKAGRWSKGIEKDVLALASTLERITTQLDALEVRVGHLEGRR